MTKGILLAAIDMANAAADEFNDWYDTEHLPQRRDCPGFLTGQRWSVLPNARQSIAIYDLEDVGVLKSPGYLAIRGENLSPWSRRLGRQYKGVTRFEGTQTSPGDELTGNRGNIALIIVNYHAGVPRQEILRTGASRTRSLLDIPGVDIARHFVAQNNDSRCMILCGLASGISLESHPIIDAMNEAQDTATREVFLAGTLYERRG